MSLYKQLWLAIVFLLALVFLVSVALSSGVSSVMGSRSPHRCSQPPSAVASPTSRSPRRTTSRTTWSTNCKTS